MKRIVFTAVLLAFISCNSQKRQTNIGETEYQIKENNRFKDASKSPLTKKDLRNFEGLDFFPVDSNFVVKATLLRIKDAPIFEMPTTTSRRPLYQEYGKLFFTINGTYCELTVYQSLDDLNDEKYKDYLFLPFTDDTSGDESYGGGRYMDVFKSKISEDNTVVLNFNNTYNPYCAYNKKYSCPLTPRKNHLDVAINAGIKDFKK